MIAVIFEVEPAEGRFDDYLGHAARLRPVLEQMPGFLSVERFRSLTNPDKLLSLSFWEDEAAVAETGSGEAGEHGGLLHLGAREERAGGLLFRRGRRATGSGP